ncbi:uncharacterized protein LOC126987540 [Eriocheir sinensis]|uniref:uncharacterized protein LOC126987540 n=1 Tax=Eriocheir sinensis TaxID=95602 RepID=UPI0021C61D77|nr:uncharacterized protein LOC126987540 [Eriocheir sinensis]
MRRRHGSGRRVTPPFGGRPCREPPRMEPAEWGCLTRSPSAPAKATMLPGKIRSTLAEPQGKAGEAEGAVQGCDDALKSGFCPGRQRTSDHTSRTSGIWRSTNRRNGALTEPL